MNRHPDLLLFDLGGVLIEYTGVRDLRPLLRVPLSESDIRQKWSQCQTTQAFEVGRLTPQQFAERFVAEWDVSIPPTDFLREYQVWTRGFLPGADALLADLRGRFRLACLSNSNETHWEQSTREHGLLKQFEMALSSHQLGAHKPEPAIYHRALAMLNVTPDAVVFFDDSAANVTAARAVGIESFQVEGITELRTCLLDRALT